MPSLVILRLPPLCLMLLLLGLGSAQAQTLRYFGQQIVPHDHEFQGTTVGGLSGLDFDARTNRFVAISDDRSERQAARFYTLSLDLAEFDREAAPGFAGVHFLAVTTLRDEAGRPHAEGAVDPEAIRWTREGALWWASEGNVRRGIPPAVEKVGADGTAQWRLELPVHVQPGLGRGVRHNLAFESLSIMGDRLVVGTENALVQDGPTADLAQPSPARLLFFYAADGRLMAEHVYPVDPVPVPPPMPGLFRTNGLVELLAGEDVLLALERSYVLGVGNGARIYRLDLAAATDVAGWSTLADREFVPVAKTLVLDLGTLGVPLDNLEGMSWGPRLDNGNRTLLLVADNNFSARQITQFLAFEVRPD